MDATLIHLSDLHFENDAKNRSRIKRLREDLKRLQRDGAVWTVFTGDIVKVGDDNDYGLLFDELIAPIIDLGHEIAVVPGNHDVQRSVSDQSSADRYLANHGSGYLFNGGDEIQNPYDDPSNDPLVNYHLFEELFGPYNDRSYWGYVRTVGDLTVVGLNSAWLSCQRGDGDSDRGKLRVEPHILERFTANLSPSTLKIALIHHPLDWLEEATMVEVSKLITSRMDLALFGHLHTGDMASVTQGDSGCVFVQAPPLRADWSRGTNGYAIIRCDVEHRKFEVEYRSYSEPRGEFVTGEDFAENGIRHPRPEDREFFSGSPSKPALIQKFIDGHPFDYTDWYRNNIRAKTKGSETFIMPKARRRSADFDDQWLQPTEPVGDTVANSSQNQSIYA